MNRSLNVRTIAILYFFLVAACGEPSPSVFQRTAESFGVKLDEQVAWRFTVDDGSEETWTWIPKPTDGERVLLLQRTAMMGGIPLPNPRQDLFRVDGLGLTWLWQGDCAVQIPPCRELVSEPLLLRIPFPPVMELNSTEVEMQPTPSQPARLWTRGVKEGLDFEFAYGWNWDDGGEVTWRLGVTTGVQEFNEVIGGGSPRHGTRL